MGGVRGGTKEMGRSERGGGGVRREGEDGVGKRGKVGERIKNRRSQI